jgi:ferredoxin
VTAEPGGGVWLSVSKSREEIMAWVITRLCRDCVDQSCVEVCPVDCIYGYDGDDSATFPNQLFIDPEECINCGVCEPECPWEAIFEDEQVPTVFGDDTDLNAKMIDAKDDFSVPEVLEKDKPSPEQVVENKTKWGYAE